MKKDFETNDERIKVHITGPNSGIPRTYRGYAYNSQIGMKISGTNVTRRINDENEVTIAINQLVRKILRKAKPSHSYERKKVENKDLDLSLPMVKAFLNLKKSGCIINGWASSTQKIYFTYFERNILPRIQYITDDEIDAEICEDELRNDLEAKSFANGNSYKSKWNAASNVQTKMYAAKHIYIEMRTIDPDLPDLSFLSGLKYQRKTKQQIKSLPLSSIFELRKILDEAVKQCPQLSMATALMEAGGLRTAEAAAIKLSDITSMNDYAMIHVQNQMNADGKIKDELKSKNSYRVVIVDKWARDLIQNVSTIISGEHEQNIKPGELNKWIKEKLLEAGVDAEELNNLRKEMLTDDELSEIDLNDDVTAYCLRRSRCSIWCNNLGLSAKEVDYLLGHKPQNKSQKKIDINHSEVVKKIAMKVNRLGKQFDNIDLNNAEEYEIFPIPKQIVTNKFDTSRKITMKIRPAEPGEAFRITGLSNNAKIKVISEGESKNGKRQNVECIGILENKKWEV